MHINRCRDFTRVEDYNSFAAVRVFNGYLRQLGGRHAWIALESGHMKIYRRVMGAAGTGLSHGDIELDYDSRLELGISGSSDENRFYDCDLTIRRARFLEKVYAHWKHPSFAYRVPYRLAVLSLALGLIGLMLGIFSILK